MKVDSSVFEAGGIKFMFIDDIGTFKINNFLYAKLSFTVRRTENNLGIYNAYCINTGETVHIPDDHLVVPVNVKVVKA